MAEYSLLIGGKAGDGITQAGQLIASLFSDAGYHIYQYTDYPSLIRGGHNFCIIRAAEKPVLAHRSELDIILALDQATVDRHQEKLRAGGTIIYDLSRVKATGIGIDIASILKKFEGTRIMGNTAIIGALCGCCGIPFHQAESVLRKRLQKETEKNLAIAEAAYAAADRRLELHPVVGGTPRPTLTGNEWIAIGLLAGGIDAYIAYPMTPSSSVLHYLASVAKEAGIDVIHPESEIAVILMALGYAYAGKRAAVGTSGGGFCLMTEGISLSGMAELPVVVVLSQRGGPSTGLPTYTGQTDLLFACHAGQGEFPRYIVAPATPEEAVQYAAEAVGIAWDYQVPAFILSDKTFSEGQYTISDMPPIPQRTDKPPMISPYLRYADSPDGISPMLAPPSPGEVIKVNSYTHDHSGITTEEPEMVRVMTEKRIRKTRSLISAVDKPGAVYSYGPVQATKALLCWGSLRGVCIEVAEALGLRVISPIVLAPFPTQEMKKAMEGVEKLILVEDSASGQLSQIMAREGYIVHSYLPRYDGRPSSVDELMIMVQGCLS